MNIPPFLERQIVRLALSKAGPYVQKGVTLAAAFMAAKLAEQFPGVEAYLSQELLTAVLWVILDSLVAKLPADVLKKYGKQIQSLLNSTGKVRVKEDGYVGPVTVQGAEAVLK